MPTVLVVDDNADIRLLERHVLTAGGWSVVEADGGPAALALLEGGLRPDLVVLDVQMPGLDGWDTLRAIRAAQESASLPVLMCTVKGGPEDTARGWDLGCDGYLPKPFDAGDLLASARAAIARPGQED